MTDYCHPIPTDRETKRRENAIAMRFVHHLLTPVIFGVAMFGIGLAAAQDDKTARSNEITSERCADRCAAWPTDSPSGERAEPEESAR